MMLLKFLLSLLVFIGALAAAGALVLSAVLMLRFPPLLVAVVLACWILCRLLKALRMPDQDLPKNSTATPQ